MKKSLLVCLLSLSIFLAGGTLVSAQRSPGQGDAGNQGIDITIPNPLKCGNNCTLFTFIEQIITGLVIPIGAILAVLAFIYSGFKYVMARGNKTAIEDAHRALLYTAIGTALLLGAWVFADAIKNTVNQLL